MNLRRPSRTGATVNKVTAVRRALAVINNLVPLQLSRRSGESKQLEAIGIFCGMDDLDRRKKEALVYMTLSTATLIACFGFALALY